MNNLSCFKIKKLKLLWLVIALVGVDMRGKYFHSIPPRPKILIDKSNRRINASILSTRNIYNVPEFSISKCYNRNLRPIFLKHEPVCVELSGFISLHGLELMRDTSELLSTHRN